MNFTILKLESRKATLRYISCCLLVFVLLVYLLSLQDMQISPIQKRCLICAPEGSGWSKAQFHRQPPFFLQQRIGIFKFFIHICSSWSPWKKRGAFPKQYIYGKVQQVYLCSTQLLFSCKIGLRTGYESAGCRAALWCFFELVPFLHGGNQNVVPLITWEFGKCKDNNDPTVLTQDEVEEQIFVNYSCMDTENLIV